MEPSFSTLEIPAEMGRKRQGWRARVKARIGHMYHLLLWETFSLSYYGNLSLSISQLLWETHSQAGRANSAYASAAHVPGEQPAMFHRHGSTRTHQTLLSPLTDLHWCGWTGAWHRVARARKGDWWCLSTIDGVTWITV